MVVRRVVAAGAALVIASLTLVPSLTGCSLLGPLIEGATGESGNTDAFEIEVGDCVYEPELFGETEDSTEVSSVDVVDCDQPHTYEAYVVQDIAGVDDEYPGEDAVTTTADELCYSEFADFVGRKFERSRLQYSFFYPTELSWSGLTDREVVCFVIDPDADETTGSFAGSRE